MKNFNVTVSPISLKTKPDSKQVGNINNNLTHQISVDMEQFSSIVCQPTAYAWTPALFNGMRKNENWRQQQVFGLDFDSGATPEEVINIFDRYGIIPNLIYTTMSDSPELRKFRVVLVIDSVITDFNVAKFIIVALMNMVEGKSDKSTKDPSRMFYPSGVAEPIFRNDDFINTQYLIDTLNTVTVANDSNKTRKCVDPKSVLKAGSLYNNIEIREFGQNGDSAKTEGIYNEGKMIDKFDFEKAADAVQIFADFLNGKWLTHPQLFGIATSLRWIEGGMKLMKDTMNKWNAAGKTFYNDNNFGILPYVAKMNYTPNNLSNYSPYEDDHSFSNIISATRKQQGLVEKILNENVISREDAETELAVKLCNILDKRKKNKIYVIAVPTGLGKTELLCKLDEEGVPSATIAFPTHQLKDDVAKRFADYGRNVKVTPKLPKFSPDIYERLITLYNQGLHSDVTAYVKEISKNPKAAERIDNKYFKGYRNTEKPIYSLEDVELAKEYLKVNTECYNETNNIVLTTHTKAMFVNFASDLMIFDECPLQEILAINKINADEIKLIVNALPESEEDLRGVLATIYEDIVKLGDTRFVEAPVYGILAEKRDVLRSVIMNPKNNIKQTTFLSFLDASHYCIDKKSNIVTFIEKRDIQGIEDKTIIIMSATAAKSVYTKLGYDVEIVDLGKVELTGELVQDTKYSYSKDSLRKRVETVSKKVGDLPVITFSDFKEYFNNPVKEMHFGNCAGYDGLKGKDIAVVGVYRKPPTTYGLIAAALGVKITNKDLKMDSIEVQYNGYKFQHFTFIRKELREIEMDYTNAELVQAVGRSRLIRSKCKVLLFAGFPLRDTTKFVR